MKFYLTIVVGALVLGAFIPQVLTVTAIGISLGVVLWAATL